jgi:hypothetical protein
MRLIRKKAVKRKASPLLIIDPRIKVLAKLGIEARFLCHHCKGYLDALTQSTAAVQ